MKRLVVVLCACRAAPAAPPPSNTKPPAALPAVESTSGSVTYDHAAALDARTTVLLDRAREAMQEGDLVAARAALEQYAIDVAGGPRFDEVIVLEIEISLRAGDRPRARQLARKLRTEYAASPLLGRVRELGL